MNLPIKLVLSLLLASAATAAILYIPLAGPAQVGLAVAVACILSTLISNSGGSEAQVVGAQREQSAVGNDESASREQGTVKWFNVSKGFGFIIRENGEEIFVHFRSIRGENKGRRGLKDGQAVSYIVVDSDKGPQAEEVDPL